MSEISRVWIAASSPLVSNTSMFVPTIMQTWNDDEAMVMDECHKEAYRTDADGTITGYTHITSITDDSGATYSWTDHYDANWVLTESGYSDSTGYSSLTQYLTSTDADGTITGYTHITSSTDASGATYSWTDHYDANWVLTESGYSDSTGYSSLTQYLTSTDANGTITGYTHITSSTDDSGASYSWTDHYDANWVLTEPGYGALEDVLDGGIGTEILADCADVDGFVFIFEEEFSRFCAVETHSSEEFIAYSLPRDFENESDEDAFIMNSLVYLGDTVAASDSILI